MDGNETKIDALTTPPTVQEINTELTTQHGEGSWTTGGGESAPTEQEIWEYGNRSLSTPNDYKADVSGVAPANEYDTELTAIQADLDNPNQYKADISSLTDLLNIIKAKTDNLPADTETELIIIKGALGFNSVLVENFIYMIQKQILTPMLRGVDYKQEGYLNLH